jgi:hypothetical protein
MVHYLSQEDNRFPFFEKFRILYENRLNIALSQDATNGQSVSEFSTW